MRNSLTCSRKWSRSAESDETVETDMRNDGKPCPRWLPVWSDRSWSRRQRQGREQEGRAGSRSPAWKCNYLCSVISLCLTLNANQCVHQCVLSVLSSLVTSCSCGRARTRVWSEAVPDTPEESPAPPPCPGGADAAYSAEKRTMTLSPKASPKHFIPLMHHQSDDATLTLLRWFKKNNFAV